MRSSAFCGIFTKSFAKTFIFFHILSTILVPTVKLAETLFGVPMPISVPNNVRPMEALTDTPPDVPDEIAPVIPKYVIEKKDATALTPFIASLMSSCIAI